MPRASTYFDGVRAALAPTGQHPRYLVIPNTDALVDAIDEPEMLAGTDGVFTENWQAILANAGDWNLSARRIAKWVTGQGKTWMADVTKPGAQLTQQERELIIGTYLLLRDATSYIMIGNGDLTWWPEYEIDLGWYLAEPPADLEALKVAGAGGASGGLYARAYSAGVVLVNSSAAPQTYAVPNAMKRVAFSGGGKVDAQGNQAAQSLDASLDVPAGPLVVPARGVVLLRAASLPPPGDEGPRPDGGVPPATDGGVATDAGPLGDGGNGAAPSGGGCGCQASPSEAGAPSLLALVALLWRRRKHR